MATERKDIREKQHRLPRECYRGEVAVSFTACTADQRLLFANPAVAQECIRKLDKARSQYHCLVLIYCFMPDHLHAILQGTDATADTWAAMAAFKQQCGFWLARQHPKFALQKDFYDHVIRADEDLGAQIRYVADNPVRKGFVKDWRAYPYTGALGIDLEDVLEGVATL